jgi:hypothetical protein
MRWYDPCTLPKWSILKQIPAIEFWEDSNQPVYLGRNPQHTKRGEDFGESQKLSFETLSLWGKTDAVFGVYRLKKE